VKGFFMKKTAWTLMCVFFAASLLGQNTNRVQHASANGQTLAFRGRGQGLNGVGGSSSHGNNGFWLERKITNPEYMQKIGISDEQAKKLKVSWKQFEDQNQKLEDEIHILARQQAELAKKILSQPGSDTKELMALVEQIGMLRIEQAKQAMQRVILVRDHLTPEQRSKLNALFEEDQKKWRAAREEAGRKHESNSEAGQKK
jgi:Spy/CpxP family protein refolding chaperone